MNVALFCDVDCGKFFNFDREKTTNYLAATILDANMYFLSLQKLSIMFAVGSLTQLNVSHEFISTIVFIKESLITIICLLPLVMY